MNISFFNSPIRNTLPRCCVTTKQIYSYIVSSHAKENTLLLRSLINSYVRRIYKAQNFDYVTFSGRFSVRKNDGLVEHSGFMCFDIDNLPSEKRLQEIKSQLINDPLLHTVLLFRSPSGNGLKWVVEVPDRYSLRSCQQTTDNRQQTVDCRQSTIDVIVKNHRVLYERIRQYLLTQYGIETDSTSDIARPCYLCHDPDAYYDEPTFHSNPSHKLLTSFVSMVNGRQTTVKPLPTSVDLPYKQGRSCREWDVADNLIRRIESRGVDITGDYHDWVRLGFAFANGFGELGRGFYHRVSQFHPRYDPNQTNRQYDNCMKSNRGLVGLGTAIKLMKN